jgi:integrase
LRFRGIVRPDDKPSFLGRFPTIYYQGATGVRLWRLGVDHFTPHDLRRTAATFMAGMGFMDEIIDAVLSHVKQGIIRTYNHHDYDKEKQQALKTWERKLNSIFTGAAPNVVSIKAGRKKASCHQYFDGIGYHNETQGNLGN